MTSAVTYVGSFPPPLGGVTVKNRLVCEELSALMPVDVLDVTAARREGPAEALRVLGLLLGSGGPVVFGLSDGWRRRLTALVAHLRPEAASRSVVLVMGGADPRPGDAGVLNAFRHTYVETEGVRAAYEAAGVLRVSVFPNCRRRPAARPENRAGGGALRS